jgi:hypothetical protein
MPVFVLRQPFPEFGLDQEHAAAGVPEIPSFSVSLSRLVSIRHRQGDREAYIFVSVVAHKAPNAVFDLGPEKRLDLFDKAGRKWGSLLWLLAHFRSSLLRSGLRRP